MTRTKPLRFQDESNMDAYVFVAAEEEDTREPLTYQEAVAYEDSSKWKAAMKEDMDSLRKNKTWELVYHPAGQKLRAGIDYNEVFSSVVQHTSIRVELALTACKDYELEQLDVKTAFLHGNLEEVIYMRQPPGYEQGNNVCLLKKSLYGLKQLPRQWSYAPSEYIYLLLYVDDMLIACKRNVEIGSTMSLLKKEFDMKELGEAKKILCMEIVRDRSRKILRVSQSGITRLGIVMLKGRVRCHMKMGWELNVLDGVHEARHSVCGFVDSDYAKDPDKGRSITGFAFLVQGCVVSWKAMLQHVVALSTIEAEYMALTEAVKEAIWLRGLLEELGVELNTVAVNCDNQGAIHLSRNHVFHERTKHINVRYHFIIEALEAKTVKVLKVGTKHNVVDALTKVIVDEIKAMVRKQIEEDKVRQLAIMNLSVEFQNACVAKDNLRKAYAECSDIPEKKRASIDTYLKQESDKDYEMHNALSAPSSLLRLRMLRPMRSRGKKGGEVVKAGTIENTKAAAAKANMEDDFCNQMMSQLKDSEDDDFAMKTIFGDISQSLKETNLPLTPLAYLGATCTSLDKLLLVVSESNNVSSSVDGLVSIVSMLLPHISSPVLRKESQFISSLITRVIHSNNNHIVVVCRGLKCVSHLIVFGHHTTWSIVSPLFSLLLSFIVNSNLKVSLRNPKGRLGTVVFLLTESLSSNS
ncbi:retrovirus-related pol polyprotein from transposon TNT 1-94 [Tanacetum coccineum]